jgi:hypothetical protein
VFLFVADKLTLTAEIELGILNDHGLSSVT